MIDRFFGVSHYVIRSGLWAQMTPTEQSLYIYLMHESERYRTRELLRTDAAIFNATGMSSRALCNARKKVQERGLLLYERSKGNMYLYTVCNPETGRPYPGDPKVPVPYRKKCDRQDNSPEPSRSADPQGNEAMPSRSPGERAASEHLESHGLPGVFD
jgi:hypothetical protein